ncbi:hypothetical protein NQ318_007181 [Aromia moschata]|uniref:Odorant receptor n=1 Tax=Aromia moschata TaxID=1265417 RepID=A0AAV8XZ39_9CUCU|nr:hypothetical protein NQ318_007181 [Aromia moschata]
MEFQKIDEKSFSGNVKILKLLGLYPYSSYPKIYPFYAYTFYVLFTCPTPILCMVNLFFLEERSLQRIVDTFFVITQIAILIVKLLPFKNNPEGVRASMEWLNRGVFRRHTPEQEVLVDKCVKTCKNIFHFFYAFCLASLFTWPWKVFFSERRILPVEIWLPFDAYEDIRVYSAVFFFVFLAEIKFVMSIYSSNKSAPACFDDPAHRASMTYAGSGRVERSRRPCPMVRENETPGSYSQIRDPSIGVGNAAVGNAALDTLVAGLICHAANQVAILKDTLEHLARTVDDQIEQESKMMSEAEKNELRSRKIYKKICKCIDHYDAIDQFVKDLEKTYSFVVFTQFVASIVVICISCLQLSIVKPFTVTFFSVVIFVTTMFIEIYLFCYYGTVLYEESDSIVNAIYMSEWYNYDNKSKKALITLMERAKRPMMVTAGKLLDLSLVTFTTIIRRSYSLLAVLKNYSN